MTETYGDFVVYNINIPTTIQESCDKSKINFLSNI